MEEKPTPESNQNFNFETRSRFHRISHVLQRKRQKHDSRERREGRTVCPGKCKWMQSKTIKEANCGYESEIHVTFDSQNKIVNNIKTSEKCRSLSILISSLLWICVCTKRAVSRITSQKHRRRQNDKKEGIVWSTIKSHREREVEHWTKLIGQNKSLHEGGYVTEMLAIYSQSSDLKPFLFPSLW